MVWMVRLVRRANSRDDGATAVEYALMLAAVAAVIVAIVFTLGDQVRGMFSATNSCLSAGSAATC